MRPSLWSYTHSKSSVLGLHIYSLSLIQQHLYLHWYTFLWVTIFFVFVFVFLFACVTDSHAIILTVLTVETSVTEITSKRKEEEDELHLLCNCIYLEHKLTYLALTLHIQNQKQPWIHWHKLQKWEISLSFILGGYHAHKQSYTFLTLTKALPDTVVGLNVAFSTTATEVSISCWTCGSDVVTGIPCAQIFRCEERKP